MNETPATGGLLQGVPPARARHSGETGGRSHDGGVATVWTAAATAVLISVLVAVLHLGAAILARHRAENAADLAALAAAREAVRGEAEACRAAAAIATAGGGVLARCRLVGWVAFVEVRVPLPMSVPLALPPSSLPPSSSPPSSSPPLPLPVAAPDSAVGQASAGPEPAIHRGRAVARHRLTGRRAVARCRQADRSPCGGSVAGRSPPGARFTAASARSSLQAHRSATRSGTAGRAGAY